MTADGPLVSKYTVRRLDGRSQVGQRHSECEYFVLDLTHDPYALEALRRYAEVCDVTHPELAVALHQKRHELSKREGDTPDE